MSSSHASAPLPPMTLSEVEEAARELQTWVGAQLQEIVIDGVKGEDPRSLRLGFFWTGGVRWVVFDYRVQAPQLLLFDGQNGVPMTPPKTVGKVRRPIELFVRSKHIGRRLREVRLRPEEGRAFDLVFDPNEDGSEVAIELKLYPHGRNVRAVSGASSIFEFKPMPLSASSGASSSSSVGSTNGAGSTAESLRPPRPLHEMALAWLGVVKPIAKARIAETGGAGVAKSPLDIKIEKRKKALEKVHAEIQAKEKSPAREIGEWIKTHQTLNVPSEWPEEWREMVDNDQNLARNIEKLFAVAKAHTRKLDGTRARAHDLEKEIAALESKRARGETGVVEPQGVVTKDLFQAAEAKGRKFQVAEDLIVYLGKNATENLAILRKAQPFDYWLHLRERPGAHAILRRARGRVVTDAELLKAGTFVAEQTMKRRAIEMKGESFDLLIVECRFVRPIKGDRLGRVHYTNDRVLRLSL